MNVDENVFKGAEERDSELSEQIKAAKEQIKAYPDNKDFHQHLLDLYKTAQDLWTECESRLREIDKESISKRGASAYSSEINYAHELSEHYASQRKEAFRAMAANTSKAYKAAEALTSAGNSIGDAGKAMQRTGHSLTVGCTIPIIIFVLLALFLMFIL